ncbi:uncharacterized protein LOC126898590 [Daktulosphaira vitifoliae]|uniref:uncharacterized protein LOC126898590 n=1 Tax=Daktulosphaira vitifoliae TaxID=58002 RepID=UPI0021AADFA2|nr:uncharacterized protein LOC126898590 [Daktulosphaira vitifoliae]XP_050528760.1 uncharacterized protein LOC126898590 [Daktulosphaira vitifoliae]XP_050528761.1 uncharacterized protein LOC126898590 [Daktulosphaira vitifoliae]
MSVSISFRKTLEICSNEDSENFIHFNKNKWLEMTIQEKNMWLKKYLHKIKREIILVYRMIVDYRGGDILQDELSELSSISSMVDIKPIKDLKSPNIQNDYLTLMVQIKELQERYNEILLELENTKNTNTQLSNRLNVKKIDQEILTDGIRVEEVEKKFNDAKEELNSMYLKLTFSEDRIDNLLGDLKNNHAELETTKSLVIKLEEKVESLTKTIEEVNKNSNIQMKRIEDLCEERKKLRIDLADASRERDLALEEIIELKNRENRNNKELIDLRSRVCEKRTDIVMKSMKLSNYIDEINEKNDQIKHMQEIISTHENIINSLTVDNVAQNKKIISLEANKISMEDKLKSWESKATCWMNSFVRDQFESKIEQQKNEIESLKILVNNLRGAYKNTETEKNGLEYENNRIIEMKQRVIEKQNNVINLMREINSHQSNELIDSKVLESMNTIFSKYEEDKMLADKLEEALIEKTRLQRLVNDYKLRLNCSIDYNVQLLE